ncbi:MAG: hypothetical protein HRU38_05615 [Saccharospirillaceae bacterium]|nr:hypothetical protein [Pseudomonadales bacterium]NRB78134.1 hypothetical protein [Saccharospirillaceae bacterium]
MYLKKLRSITPLVIAISISACAHKESKKYEEMPFIEPEETHVVESDYFEDSSMIKEFSSPVASSISRDSVPESYSVAESSPLAIDLGGTAVDGLVASKIIEKKKPLPASELRFQSGSLTSGILHDNLNYDDFITYANQSNVKAINKLDAISRQFMVVFDRNNDLLTNHPFTINIDGKKEFHGTTSSFGHLSYFPIFDDLIAEEFFEIQLKGSAEKHRYYVQQDGRPVSITINDIDNTNLDIIEIAYIIDATGSMTDELEYLKIELIDIINSVSQINPGIEIFTSIIVYRDTTDEYITKTSDFSVSPAQSIDFINKQFADGGGDFPEAMDSALVEALKLSWIDSDHTKMLFLLADAPPHNENILKTFDLLDEFREKGISINPIAASGVEDTAQAVMRTLAVTTNGNYLFLTDDSGYGNSHAEPSNTCYIVTTLKESIIRTISSEIQKSKLEPAARQIIRQVGEYDKGLCGGIKE